MVDPGTGGCLGNIILNHDFSEPTLEPWQPKESKVEILGYNNPVGIRPKTGNRFAFVTERSSTFHGLQQEITSRLYSGSIYSVSAWLTTDNSTIHDSEFYATLLFEFQDSGPKWMQFGYLLASKGEWERMEGTTFSFSPIPHKVWFYLEGPDPSVDLLIDSVEVYEIPRGTCDQDGNIILNPQFEDRLNGWSGKRCKLLIHKSLELGGRIIYPLSGKFFVSATSRKDEYSGIQQDITARVQPRLTYQLTMVVRISGNNVTRAEVKGTLYIREKDLHEHYIHVARSQVTDQEWTTLQGTFLLTDAPSTVVFFLEGPNESINIHVDSLTIKHAQNSTLRDDEPADVAVNNIIENSNLIDGMTGWSVHKNCTLQVRSGSPRIIPPLAKSSFRSIKSPSGRYIFVENRTSTSSGPLQNITNKIKPHVTYQVSAWVSINLGATGPQNVQVTIEVDDQRMINGGKVEAHEGRWHELAGSFRLEKTPQTVKVYVHGPSVGVNLMVAALQIFPVDRKSRFEHLKACTEKVRMRDVILKFSGNLRGRVTVTQKSNSFHFGACVTKKDLENETFVNFFKDNFSWAVIGNELKWRYTEPQKGEVSYNDADELLKWCSENTIETRGHCIFTEVEDDIQPWVRSLKNNDLATAVENRCKSLLKHFRNKFRHYDVNNEMLHGSFYRDRLGKSIWPKMFKRAHELDKSATLFVNEYHVEDGSDTRSSPKMYVQHIHELQEQGAPVGGIGIQGHINSPIGPIVCSALDALGATGIPIWFTELDVSSTNENVRADDLEVMLREGFAHPAVHGIMFGRIWELFLLRDNAGSAFVASEVAKRYSVLRNEWESRHEGNIDNQGQFSFRGFHGSYRVEVAANAGTVLETFDFDVNKGASPQEELLLHMKLQSSFLKRAIICLSVRCMLYVIAFSLGIFFMVCFFKNGNLQ